MDTFGHNRHIRKTKMVLKTEPMVFLEALVISEGQGSVKNQTFSKESNLFNLIRISCNFPTSSEAKKQTLS